MKICRACGGSGLIKLRLLPEFSAVTDAPPINAFMSDHKDFPCPACSPSAPAERVGFVTHEARVYIDYANRYPRYIDSLRTRMAADLGRHMLEKGHIIFTERMDDPDLEFGRPPYRILDGKVGVITAGQVATMDERTAIHQERVAVEVVQEAVRLIDNWGSYYGWQEIRKDDARREIHKALQNVLDKRAAK